MVNKNVMLNLLSLSGLALFLLLAFGSGDGESSIIDLDARINYRDGQFTITNNDSFYWKDVKFELNDDYILKVSRIDAGGVYTVGSMQFTKKDGTKFNPFTHKPLEFFIWAKTPEGKSASYYGTWK